MFLIFSQKNLCFEYSLKKGEEKLSDGAEKLFQKFITHAFAKGRKVDAEGRSSLSGGDPVSKGGEIAEEERSSFGGSKVCLYEGEVESSNDGEETGGDNLGDIFSFDSIFCRGEEEEGSGDEDERERAVRRSS